MTEFQIIIIKPNICGSDNTTNSDYFEENVYKLLNYYDKYEPYNNIENALEILANYLSKKDYLITNITNMGDICKSFEKYVNPNDETGRRYELKTCINNEDEIIMYLYDYSFNRFPALFNHIASILNPNMESVFGPVFMTKIKKINGKLVHENITLLDIAKLWFSTKQITIWDFTENWTLKNMFNNNFGVKDNYKFEHINNYIVFYKLRHGIVLEQSLKELLKKNDINELNKLFENIKVCKLQTGEYVNEHMKSNADLLAMKEHIGKTAMNAFEDRDKYQIVMESIFQNIEKIYNLNFG